MPYAVEIKTDTSELESLNRSFSGKEWLRIRKRAIGKMAAALKRAAVKQFKIDLPAAAHKNSNYTDRLIDAVRKSKTKVRGEVVETAVHTLGTRATGSRTFMARFFEGGTKERIRPAFVDKLGRKYPKTRLGKIDPTNYFQKSNKNQEKVYTEINTYISAEIDKIYKKRRK